ncbi:MAG: hypothetical protein HY299_07055 [Verrucomicrobia bacterium]|nr:hypothetical protein [Verrucomicrobiota bacterium]
MNRKPGLPQILGGLFFVLLIPVLYVDSKLFPENFGALTFIVMFVYAALCLFVHRIAKTKPNKPAGVSEGRSDGPQNSDQ